MSSFAANENIKGAQFNNGNVKKDDSFLIVRSSDTSFHYELGPEISSFEYKEPGIMKETGALAGIHASCSWRNKALLRLEGRFSYGKVDYESSGTGTMDSITDMIFETRGIAGYNFEQSETFTVTPYIGIAYRYLRDDTSGEITSTGAHGYLRQSNYFYLPLGIEVNKVLANGWSIGATAEYDQLLEGRQKSRISDVESGYGDATNTQDTGFGLRGSIRIKKDVDSRYYVAEPYIQYWEIDKSDNEREMYGGVPTGYYIYEPKNTTMEIGVKLGIGF
jgi:hypothetical protein